MFKIHLFPSLFSSELFKSSDAIFLSRGHDGQEKYQSSSRSTYRQYYGFLLSSCPPALLSSCIIKNTSKKLLLNLFLREQVKKVKKRLNCICELNDDFNGRN